MAKKYGLTWWGNQWLDAFKGIDFTNRLPRGHAYAGNGSVLGITIQGCHVNARVQGSRPRPYKVSVNLRAFTRKQQESILNIISQNPPILSRLLNRQLSPRILPLLESKNIFIFPKNWDDMEASCSCPDWAMPCKHIAAVIYLVAGEIDKNPFSVFHLHDMELSQAIEKKTGLNTSSLDQPSMLLDQWKEASAVEKTSSPENISLYSPDLAQIESMHERIFSILPEVSLFYQGDFRKVMASVYKRAAKYVTSLKKKMGDVDTFHHDVTDFQQLTLTLSREFGFFKLKTNKETLDITDINGFFSFFYTMSNKERAEITHRNYHHSMLWYYLFHTSMKLVERQAIIPQIYQREDGAFVILWQPAILSESVRTMLDSLHKHCPSDLVIVEYQKSTHDPKKNLYADEKKQIETALHVFISFFLQQAFLLQVSEKSVNNDMFQLFFNMKPYYCGEFNNQAHPKVIRNWLSRLLFPEREHRLYLLVDESEDEQLSIDVKIEQGGQMTTLTQCFGEKGYSRTKTSVLADLAILAEYLPDIESLYEKNQPLIYSLEKFTPVFLNVLPLLKMLGIQLILPKQLKNLAYPKLSLSLSKKTNSDVSVSYLNLDELLGFKWQIAIGDKRVSPDEFELLVKGASGLVKIVDQYVMLDNTAIQNLLKKLTKLSGSLSRMDLVKAGLSEEIDGAPVDLGMDAKKLLNELFRKKPVSIPYGLNATLRPYQERGFQWMAQNAQAGFGSLIADDMGLGKTLQVITFLLYQKTQGQLDTHKALVIAPTSLLTNWRKEIENFAPSLRTLVYHGSERIFNNADYDIVLTSYGLARSDNTKLNRTNWRTLVIDEAQNIKNPASLQTKAVKKLKADVYIGMSGTPVENRLREYWSLFDFSNRNYLGTMKRFQEDFARPIEQDGDKGTLDRFKKITAPFILRRLKNDKSIISDLPDKIESDRYCSLGKKQTALYQSTVDKIMKELSGSDEGIERKGIIFKLINALKQICNSPAQFLGHEQAIPEESGKLATFVELMSEAMEAGEKVLVFTQYTTMGELLTKTLRTTFDMKVPFLHGGLSRKKRDEIVDDFQGNLKAHGLILSLKAGGTGLNLTAASQVIHYDLWWNPAVEAQATDRAYRIGQKKNVQVHRLITENTFEEKIDAMIRAKKNLANLTVESGEQWITELSDTEIRDLVSLQ